MSLLLKKLNQASAQQAADDAAEKPAESSQPESAQPQDAAGAPPAPQAAPASAAAAAQPATAKPAAPATPAQPTPGGIGIKPRPVAPATSAAAPVKPAPATGAPGSVGLRSAPPRTAPAPVAKAATPPAGVKPAATSAATATATPPKPKAPGVQLETAADVGPIGKRPQAGRKLSRGLRTSEYFDRARGIVSATRIFGAQASESGKQWPKLLAAAAVLVIVAGGGFYAYSQFSSDVAGGPSVSTPAQRAAAAREEFAVVTLPTPEIDVQAQAEEVNPQSQFAVDTPEVTISGEEAIAAYEIVPDVQYSDEEWSLIEREEREAAEAEEQDIAILAASEAIGVETGREIAVQIESQRDDIDVPDDNISVRAVDTAKAENRAEVKTSENALRRADKLSKAADLYSAGKYERAGQVYGEVLRDTPTSLQALRGSALAATALKRYKLAADFYVKILEYFPDDPLAIAELSNLGGIDPVEVERLLVKLLGKTPAVDGRLYFALGNLYAASSRWRKARDAFGDALSRERNADYAYNLAVAMEYLSERELAAHYYRQALQMAQGSLTAGFDADQVKARIAVLDL